MSAPSRIRRLSALALILVTGSCSAAPVVNGPSGSSSNGALKTSASQAGGTTGSAGYGDPDYPLSGNGGYDVRSYDVALSYDPASNTLQSTAHVKAEVTSPAGLSRFNLDLQPTMTVSAVSVNGRSAKFSRQGAELVITPGDLLAPKSAVMVEIRYGGSPTVDIGQDGELDGGWYRTKSGGAVAVGEPVSASAWYPVNEHPGDTATFAVSATVPTGWKVISNGLPYSSGLPDPGPGRSVFGWRLNEPVASYLTTIYIDKFTTVQGRLPDGKPIISAIGPGVDAKEVAAQTSSVIGVLTGYFGSYPFGSAGGIFPGELSDEMELETATRPVYSGSAVRDADLVAHELAHQWFGNSVTLSRWSDICINECFASYAAWLWDEKVNGTDLDSLWEHELRGSLDDRKFWRSPLVAMPVAEQFTSVYDRGPLALHALRKEMGDEKFLAMLKKWTATYKGKHASFHDFEAMASTIAKRDLAPFIDAWFRGTTVPPKDLRYPGNLGR